MRRIIVFFLLVILAFSCKTPGQNGRNYTSDKNRAIRKYEEARTAYDAYQEERARELLLKAARIDQEFVEPWLLLGKIYLDEQNDSLALQAYEKAAAMNPRFFPAVHFNIGKLHLRNGDYENAKHAFLRFQKLGRNANILERNERYLRNVEFALEQIKNPVDYKPVNLGPNINSPHSEWINSITVDESYMIFTVLMPDPLSNNQRETEDFFHAYKNPETGEWQPRKKMGSHFNTPGEEGAMFISPDKSFLVFSGCNRDDGYGSCDLYISYRKGNRWTLPKNMGPRVNSRKWDSHPTVAPDNRTVYFASTRKGGLGASDLYKTTLKDDSTWSYPQNLGSTINTPQSEQYPFIHTDNKTMYFSSSGHLGMGELDFFVSRREKNGWSKPQNLGYPINTHQEEIGLQVNARGELAYISTDRLKGEGKHDIYSLHLPEHAKPEPATYMKGVVFDAQTKKPLKAEFELIDLETQQTEVQAYSNQQSGDFLLAIPTNKNYALNVKKDGYLFYSESFELKGVHTVTDPFLKDVPLKKIQVGETVVLNNIFFEFDEYELLPESKAELEGLTRLLVQNPEMDIRIQGHTDNQGDKQYNQKLSENRAMAVYNFLLRQGIDEARLSYKGFGESQPVATNETEEGRAKNRRTEFVVVQ
ncbi:MAG: OmpA family protein [Bacteroidota bacterium]